MSEDVERFQAARYAVARAYIDTAAELMKELERDKDADLLSHGVAVNAAWNAFCEMDHQYHRAKGAKGDD